jgi:integrase
MRIFGIHGHERGFAVNDDHPHREGGHRPAAASEIGHPARVGQCGGIVERFGYGPNARLIAGPYRGLIDESTYLGVWQRARATVRTSEDAASPLARRPYDLRHTAVSTWLNAGVPPAQVAEWAGHSVAARTGRGGAEA